MNQQNRISRRRHGDSLMKTNEQLKVWPPSAEPQKDVQNITSKMSQINETMMLKPDGGVHWDPGQRSGPGTAQRITVVELFRN